MEKPIKRFKIYGERNSGNNFLWKLLETNFGRALDQIIENNVKYYWRHANPDNSIKIKYPGIVEVFVIRNLNDWLVSMYKNPYHLKKFKKFDRFLLEKQKSNEKQYIDFRTNQIINIEDTGKTIFEIRYYKMLKIFEYLNNNDNIIIVNLENLQNEKKCRFFLDKIKEVFNFKPKNDEYKVVFPHTKSKTNVKNREYNVDVTKYKNIINSKHNIEIENKIKNIFLIKHNNKIINYNVNQYLKNSK